MLKHWANYRLRVMNFRQKYSSIFRRRILVGKTKISSSFNKNILKRLVIPIAILGAYYYADQMYSEHIEIKKMKKKLMKAYPTQTYIISFDEDPMELMRQVSINNNEGELQVNRIQNNHCILLNDNSEQTQKFKEKLGSALVIFSPKSIDQLSHAIQRCNQYRHSAIVGYYPFPSQPQKQNYKQLKNALNEIPEPVKKKKYIVIDLSLFKNVQIDTIDHVLSADTGVKCRQINQFLVNRGYEPLFQEFYCENSLYEAISNNWPLTRNDSLSEKIQNLSLVSAEGLTFKSSTQVQKFGQIPNLTPLFLGTGGAIAIPANASISVNLKSLLKPEKLYSIESANLSELVIKWRQIRNYLSARGVNYSLKIIDNKVSIKTSESLQQSKLIGFNGENQIELNKAIKPNYIFSINSKIIQKILLNPIKGIQMDFQNNLLKVESKNKEEITKFISKISIQGAVLVWCQNPQIYNQLKERIDLTETGAEFMKKIVEIREALDKKHILYSHSRYQKYFSKSFFRRITSFFW